MVESLRHEAFGFEGVGLYLAGTTSFDPALRASSGDFRPGDASRAELRLPLRIDQNAIGEVVVQRDGGRAFEQGDLEILAAAANQAGIAIGRSRLLATDRQRLAEQRALLDTLADLSGQLEPDKLLQAVLERAVALLDVTGGELAIFDERAQQLVIVASQNMGTNAVGTRMALGEGAMGHVGKTLEPLIIPRYQEWESRSAQYIRSTIQTVMAAPLVIGDRLVGAIASVHSDPARTFGQRDLRLLNLFAAQAAIAIENARLFSAERERAEEQEAVLDTMQDLSGELELSKVLERVLQRAVSLLGVTGGELATFDEARQDLVIVSSYNLETNAVGTRMALGEGAMGRVAKTHEPLIIPRYQEWEGHSGKYERSSIQSVMAAPLLIGSATGGRDRQRARRRVPGIRRRRPAPADDVRPPGGDRHRERAALLRRAAALRNARQQQSGGDRQRGPGGAHHLLQPGVRAAVRVPGGRGERPRPGPPRDDGRFARRGARRTPIRRCRSGASPGGRDGGAARTARRWTSRSPPSRSRWGASGWA